MEWQKRGLVLEQVHRRIDGLEGHLVRSTVLMLCQGGGATSITIRTEECTRIAIVNIPGKTKGQLFYLVVNFDRHRYASSLVKAG